MKKASLRIVINYQGTKFFTKKMKMELLQNMKH